MDSREFKRQRRLTTTQFHYFTNSDDERESYTEFLDAACQGDLKTMKRMLAADSVPVDCLCNSNETTALHVASLAGHWHIVQVLIQAGANVNHVESDGTTALHAAFIYSLNVQVVQELLKAGCQVDVKGFGGQTPLLWLLQRPRDIPQQVEICCLLLEAGCNVNIQANDGSTALLRVCQDDRMEEIF